MFSPSSIASLRISCRSCHSHHLSYLSLLSLLSRVTYSITDANNGKTPDFFKELLKSSKRDCHTMFLQTYGLLYERNSYIITDMFQELEKYYSATGPPSASGSGELDTVLDSFFHRLLSKMFQVLNAQYTFDDTYLTCVSEKMEDLKPFGEVSKKLKNEFMRSFVPTQTFTQSVNAAAVVWLTCPCSRTVDQSSVSSPPVTRVLHRLLVQQQSLLSPSVSCHPVQVPVPGDVAE